VTFASIAVVIGVKGELANSNSGCRFYIETIGSAGSNDFTAAAIKNSRGTLLLRRAAPQCVKFAGGVT
jgi:hypothetical protein